MKKFSLILAAASLCALFSSCNKEEKAANALVGTWSVEKYVTEYVKDHTESRWDETAGKYVDIVRKAGDTVTETPSEAGTGLTFTFRDDDLCVLIMAKYEDGAITREQGAVTPYSYDESEQTVEIYSMIVGKVTKVTESELHIQEEQSNYAEGVYANETFCCKRVK